MISMIISRSSLYYAAITGAFIFPLCLLTLAVMSSCVKKERPHQSHLKLSHRRTGDNEDSEAGLQKHVLVRLLCTCVSPRVCGGENCGGSACVGTICVWRPDKCEYKWGRACVQSRRRRQQEADRVKLASGTKLSGASWRAIKVKMEEITETQWDESLLPGFRRWRFAISFLPPTPDFFFLFFLLYPISV